MQFAFVYKSDEKAGTWEIKSVTVKGDGATVEPEPEVPEPADDDITLIFGKDYNSTSVSSYTSTWNVTVNDLTWTIENFNNNNNGWEYVKCGRKNEGSTGYITTDFSINEAVSAVQLTVDALTASKVTSISLLVASSDQFTDAATYTVTPAQGTLTINITAPAANKFYRLAVACEGGSSNGLFTLSKVVYLGGKTATAEEVPEVKAESLADFIAKTPEKNDEAVMDCPLTVVYVNGAYVYVKDETASSLIYKKDLGYEKGDVIPAGWKGANSTYNGLYEIVPKTDMPAATETVEVVYPEATAVNLDMVNQVVILKNVTFDAETPAETANFTGKLADDTEVTFRNAFKIASVAAGEYNVTLAVARYNANLQVYPIEYNATSAIEAIADDNAAAEYFNLQGMSIDADNLTPGIYVRRQGNKVSKVIVK